MVVVKNISHMNTGDDEKSYANNSSLQRTAITAALPILHEALKLMHGVGGGFPRLFRIVDLGCSSGSNTLYVVSHILDKIEDLDMNNSHDFEVFLNDLPDNDFNNLFKLLPSLNKKCFLYASPGSFYNRLFASNSLHFAFSSYSLHWLSQVPEYLGNNNKENIYIARGTPPKVLEAYTRQFQKDFSMFLSLRGKEIVWGGRMVLTVPGRGAEDHSCEEEQALLTLLAETLLDMVSEGQLKMEDLHSFNVPKYYPSEKEVEAVVRDEGSFNLHKLQVVENCWGNVGANGDGDDDKNKGHSDECKRGKLLVKCIRAIMEPMVAAHFGSSIVDEVFERYMDKVTEYLSVNRFPHWRSLVISLCRK